MLVSSRMYEAWSRFRNYDLWQPSPGVYEAQKFPCYSWGDQVSVHRGTHEAGKLLGAPGVHRHLQLIEFPTIKNLESR